VDAALRAVLDTNVTLDLLHFQDPAVAAIDAAVRAGRLAVMTSAACTEELRRVLAYPEFGLDEAGRATLLARYRALARMSEMPGSQPPRLPRCADADDQKFLDLAWHCGAALLVSKDKAILRLARRMARAGGCNIVAPRDFRLPGASEP
jgi:putative PIN family toxin of toxin-antitoxin system